MRRSMLHLARLSVVSSLAVSRPFCQPSNPALLRIGAVASRSTRSGFALQMSSTASGGTPIPGFKTTFTILKPGDGDAKVEKGSSVTVHATGVVVETGKKFWSTKDPGQQPFSYVAGVGQVITGWDQGLLGMSVGEQRLVVIPADEGYGAGGFPEWGIPAGGTLEFTLQVLTIT